MTAYGPARTARNDVVTFWITYLSRPFLELCKGLAVGRVIGLGLPRFP